MNTPSIDLRDRLESKKEAGMDVNDLQPAKVETIRSSPASGDKRPSGSDSK